MKATMTNVALARYAGRFVWLDLDFDKPQNQAFIAGHGVIYTPTVFVLDPGDDHATASRIGGMTLVEVKDFLEQGERGYRKSSAAPADAAVARGDELVGRGRLADAVAAYREALRLAAPGWAGRNRAIGSLTRALNSSMDYQACAELAAAQAPKMSRGTEFANVVLFGFADANRGGKAPWSENARKTLQPLAVEALSVRAATRDIHFQLYQQLMHAASMRGDKPAVDRWGNQWLGEIESIAPANDDERSALDIARVDAAGLMENPERVIPALEASERAMPGNYNASLRLAQMDEEAKRYDEAIAAAERGLRHVTGPVGRVWLLKTEADALYDKGDREAARRTFQEALKIAESIPSKTIRDNQVRALTEAIHR
jgi:tetratricopeptide (TPR) repeat protein